MMTNSNPPTPPSKEPSIPLRGTPPSPEPQKKPDKKLETPVLVAIISAIVTLVTSFLGSPLLLSMVNKTDSPTSTSASELVVSQHTPLPNNALGGKFFKATFTPTRSDMDLIESTSTLQGEFPTSAPPIFESTFTPTTLPPKKPDPPTQAAPSFLQCIAADLWFPYPSTLTLEISKGCWNLAEWGYSTDQGRLLLAHNSVQDQQRGIYTPISGDVDIRFSVQLNEFRTRSNKVGFLNFGIVQNDPFSIYTGGYLSYQQPTPGAASPVRVLISGTNQATQKISVLEDGFQQEVLLSIEDDLMVVYLNGKLTGDPVSLPSTDRAFWIGYVLPSRGELDVITSNLNIQTH